MQLTLNNINFEIIEDNGKYALYDKDNHMLLGVFDTEKEAYSEAHMYERITVPFNVLQEVL